MNQWDHFFLVAVAAIPGPALLALSCIVYFLRRRIGVVSAVSMSLGAALCLELIISVAVHASDLLYPFRGSLVGLIGLPLVAYVGTLLWLTRRWRISKPLALLGGALGLPALFYMGVLVLMLSVCGISLGGC
jgi:peptidoglycan/LPS O-acetylase OafA/YrhL